MHIKVYKVFKTKHLYLNLGDIKKSFKKIFV